MGLTPVKTPAIIPALFPNYVWSINTSNQELYLTFDDGPTPVVTNWTLDTLDTFNAKATFFCIGKNVEKYPEIYNEILLNGHAVGNHTQNHVKGWKASHQNYIKNVEEAKKHIDSSLFRPPYGKLTPKQGKTLLEKKFKIVMWDVLSMDWDTSISPETCLENVINKSNPGSIIVFHDSVKASVNLRHALPKVLEYFSEKGFEFKKLTL